jgi:hypothetical protein
MRAARGGFQEAAVGNAVPWRLFPNHETDAEGEDDTTCG